MLEHLFTSKARIRLMKLFLFNQDQEYHLRQASKIVGISPIYTSKELANLERLGLVRSHKKANLKIFSLNQKCIILKELREIFLKTDLIGETIRKSLSGMVKFCFIYGSFAKGTESAHSDIDLFVVSSMKEDDIIRIIQRIEENTGREINYVLWNEKTFNDRKGRNHLLNSIKDNPIIMIIGDENELRRTL